MLDPRADPCRRLMTENHAGKLSSLYRDRFARYVKSLTEFLVITEIWYRAIPIVKGGRYRQVLLTHCALSAF